MYLEIELSSNAEYIFLRCNAHHVDVVEIFDTRSDLFALLV
jgi:hypothetical protein